MDIEDNEAGGKSIAVSPGDDLADVPPSHRELITPELRRVFADPIAHFREVAARCPLTKMAAFLRRAITSGHWTLMLHRGDPTEWNAAGILFLGDNIRSVEIAPAEAELSENLPASLRQYHFLVGCVRWMPFGLAGELDATTTPLSNFPYGFHGAQVDPTRTLILGGSLCGDSLFYTLDERGGWFCHENGYLHCLGTIHETIDWVYGELLADRTPEFDYEWLKGKR